MNEHEGSKIVSETLAALESPPIVEGKTKRVFALGQENVVVVSKDDITAGDGAKHDLLSGKAEFANATTCNVFSLLRSCGVPVAYWATVSKEAGIPAFYAEQCDMLPFEVVVRRAGYGSYLKRHPEAREGKIFFRLLVEFFLKTNNRHFRGVDLPCDDPLMVWGTRGIELRKPNLPEYDPAGHIAFMNDFPLEAQLTKDELRYFDEMEEMARMTFLILEKAWQLQDGRLVDFKIEFGENQDGELRIADVIDNDSWRVLHKGQHLDKQVYRDGGSLSEVVQKYAYVARRTEEFRLPKQQILLVGSRIVEGLFGKHPEFLECLNACEPTSNGEQSMFTIDVGLGDFAEAQAWFGPLVEYFGVRSLSCRVAYRPVGNPDEYIQAIWECVQEAQATWVVVLSEERLEAELLSRYLPATVFRADNAEACSVILGGILTEYGPATNPQLYALNRYDVEFFG